MNQYNRVTIAGPYRAGVARSSGGTYHSYLVRLWQDEEQTTWRALAQSVQSGETLHFADVESLFAFLRAQTVCEPPTVGNS
ncbi:MAG: hypothetical protein KDE54_09390 [Caldilineaceae bacterium]|nr:hypothetical protein [Caldilineaceae bacterium]MCB0094450.1 hypothetical protein [Caldilineaceae bacterium]MCB0139964.1 hypothetical protein [Caldilineaceae bacterium]